MVSLSSSVIGRLLIRTVDRSNNNSMHASKYVGQKDRVKLEEFRKADINRRRTQIKRDGKDHNAQIRRNKELKHFLKQMKEQEEKLKKAPRALRLQAERQAEEDLKNMRRGHELQIKEEEESMAKSIEENQHRAAAVQTRYMEDQKDLRIGTISSTLSQQLSLVFPNRQISTIIGALRGYLGVEAVQEYGFRLLTHMTYATEANKIEVGEAGGAELVVEGVSAHRRSRPVLRQGMCLLRNLCYRNEENKARAWSANAAVVVVNALRYFAAEVRLQAAGLRLIAVMCSENENVSPLVRSVDGLVSVVMEALRQHSRNGFACAPALEALTALARCSDELRGEIVECEAVALITEVMVNHNMDGENVTQDVSERVQRQGLYALSALFAHPVASLQVCSGSASCAAVAVAVKQHCGSAHLAMAAAQLLRAMALKPPPGSEPLNRRRSSTMSTMSLSVEAADGDPSVAASPASMAAMEQAESTRRGLREAYRDALGERGAVAGAVAVMDTCPQVPLLMFHTCLALRALCGKHDRNMIYADQAGIGGAIVKCLKLNFGHPPVVEQLCLLVTDLAARADLRRSLMQFNTLTALERARDMYLKTHEGVAHTSKIAMFAIVA